MNKLVHLLLSSLPVLGCARLDGGSDADPSRGSSPFSITIVDVLACPLPAEINPKEKRVLGVKLRVESAHPGRIGANYFYGSLLTRNGDRYLAELSGCEPVLSSSPLAPGESAEGFLNFPLPLDETPHKVVYAPNLDRTQGSDALLPRDVSQELVLP